MVKKIAVAASILLVLFCVGTVHAYPSVVKIGTNAIVEEGSVVEDAVVIGGDLVVNGTVMDDTVVIGGDLHIGSTGRLLGDSVVIFGKLIKSLGADVKNNSVEIPLWKPLCKTSKCVIPMVSLCALGFIGVTMLIGFLALLLLIAVLFINKIGKASFYIEKNFLKSFYYGLVATILFVPLLLLLVVSIIGIPIVPLFVILVSAATLFGYTVVCQLIGLKFFKAIKKPGRPMCLEVIVGFLILALASLVPFAGWLIKLIAWMIGLGATVATRFGTK